MNSKSSFPKTCLAVLLLAGCGSSLADPDTLNPVAQQPVEARAPAPVTPTAPPAAATDPAAVAPVVASEPVSAAAPPDDEQLTAEMNAAGGEPDASAAGDPGSADAPEAPSAAAAAIDPETLYGAWTVSEQHPDAGEVVTLFSVNADSTFAGTMTVAGNVVWEYSGNWYLDGNLITWFYTQSTPPLMLVDETEVDEIIAVDSEKLTYRSGTRDVLETLYRSR
jgi:hypothetical protein